MPQYLFAIDDNQTPVRGEMDALAPWWSLTKTVLAAATLKLVDKGLINLEDPFEDSLEVWPFTLHQLLQHTSGLNTYGGPVYQQAVAAGDPVWSVAELLERAKARKLFCTPGEDWAYSNIGYLFVRQLIESTMDCPLNDALRELVFEPMQIKGTRIARTPDDMASTYWGNSINYNPRWVYHGLLIGPPSDAVRFLRGLMEGKFLASDTLSMMLSTYALGDSIPDRPWTKIGYGLGLMMGKMGDAGRAIGHSGVGHDTVSALYYFPDLPHAPIVSAFAQGTDEAVVEHEAVRLALLK